jgi:hypothetical protein
MACQSVPDRHRLESYLSAVIFLGLFLYIGKGIEPPLLYYGFGVFAAYPIVFLEGSFLRATFGTPGGPLGGCAALLAQSYSHAWLGAGHRRSAGRTLPGNTVPATIGASTEVQGSCLGSSVTRPDYLQL